MKIVVVTPNAPLAEYLKGILATGHPDAEIVVFDAWEPFTQAVTSDPAINAALVDIIWGDENTYYAVRQLSLILPKIGWLIVSPFDLSTIVNRYSNIPAVSAPQDAFDILQHLPMLLEDRRGKQVGPYQLLEFAGQSALGRAYKARHLTVDRMVTVTLPPPNAAPDVLQGFRIQASILGRVSHPAIYAIYEFGEHEGRPFLAHEPVAAPTLLELQTKGESIDSRTLARVLNRVGAAMNYITSTGLYYSPIDIDNITLAKDGVVKITNVAIGTDEGTLDLHAQLASLSEHLSGMLPQHRKAEPAISSLLSSMRNHTIKFEDFVVRSEQVEMALAPVKNVPVRREQVAAEKEVAKSKSRNKLFLLIGIPAALIAVALLVVLILRTAAPVRGTNFTEQCKIPAGTTSSLDPAGVVNLNEFYVDKYEVTIAQYQQFLEASKDKTIEQLLPDDILSNYGWPNQKLMLERYRTFKTTYLKCISLGASFRDRYKTIGDRVTQLNTFSIRFAALLRQNPTVNPKPELPISYAKEIGEANQKLLVADFKGAREILEKLAPTYDVYRDTLKATYAELLHKAEQKAGDTGEPVSLDNPTLQLFNRAGYGIDTITSISQAVIGQIKEMEASLSKAMPSDAKPIQAFYPDDWTNIKEKAAFRNSFYMNIPITMNTPVFNVDFVDALAYARWAGKRLLTEAEWQRAAMGNSFFTYPWGNDMDVTRANVGRDPWSAQAQVPRDRLGKSTGWLPVDGSTRDVSPFGVIGLAGNVSEWTTFVIALDKASQDRLNPKAPAPTTSTNAPAPAGNATNSPASPETKATEAAAPLVDDSKPTFEELADPWVQVPRGGNFQNALRDSIDRGRILFFYRHPSIGIRVGSNVPMGRE